MRCVLMSELQKEVFAESLKNISAHNIKKVFIVTYADDEKAIVEIYKKKYNKKKVDDFIKSTCQILRSMYGENLEIEVSEADESDRSKWMQSDIIVILGGHAKSCMEKLTNLKISRETQKDDVIYIGVSAGAKVLCDYFLSKEKDDAIKLHRGMGVVNDLILLVHYGKSNQESYMAYLKKYMKNGRAIYGIANDGYICIDEVKKVMHNVVKIK